MSQPYQILLDIWEGNPDLHMPTLTANDVVGLIVRLNDMNGGHHMDQRFVQNWELAKQFPVQTIYFVYNPWVDGRANYAWLMAHLPADFGQRRIMIDIEVRFAYYSPKTYAAEFALFLALVKQTHTVAIYTGAWFLPILASWPADEDYWWAAYPNRLTASKTWAEYKANLAPGMFQSFTKTAPGPARLWQSSGDGVKLEGFGNHAVDVNIFPGSLAELAAWLGVPDPGTAEPLPTSGTVCVDGLRLRLSPGLDGRIAGSLSRDTQVEILERVKDAEGEWLRVRVEGYVAGYRAGSRLVK